MVLGSRLPLREVQFLDLYWYKEHMSSLKEALCDWMPAGYIFCDSCSQWKRYHSPLEMHDTLNGLPPHEEESELTSRGGYVEANVW